MASRDARAPNSNFAESKLMMFLFQESAGGGSFLISILPFLLIFAVFYFLVIVPQKRKQQQLQQVLSSLKPGDRIITTGGIIGTIKQVREDSLIVLSAEKSMLEIARSAVASKETEETKTAS
jgi:preprotein translocase subunit YajC